jgi:Uma2 family endonuclease
MLQALVSPPRTLMEVFKMLPEGTLAEIINNQLYMSPSPVGKHQRILRDLFRNLDKFIVSRQLGEVFFAPFDVFLDEETNVVQPDLIFVSSANLHIVDDDGVIHGVPDMLIEVLSPGNPEHDTKTKKDLYEHFGVKEYWIVDPATKSTTGYTLAGRRYQKIDSVPGKINSLLLNHSFDF